MGQYFGGARRAEAHGIGHAIILSGATVGEAWRQVEHVAGCQHPFIGWFELSQDLQIGVGEQRAVGIAHLANLPAAMAVRLQQEYVVVVEMRADAATGGSEADHQVVDAPLGQELEVLQQLGHFRNELVDGLDQQGPVALGQILEGVFVERAALQLPGAFPVLDHQARFDFLFQRQASQFVRADRAFEVRDRLTHQQRFLLPVVAQELTSREATQQLQRSIRIHQ